MSLLTLVVAIVGLLQLPPVAARARLGPPIPPEHGYPTDDEVPPGLLDYFCLSNAKMRTVTYEFIVVQTASVGAFFPGRLTRQDGGRVG